LEPMVDSKASEQMTKIQLAYDSLKVERLIFHLEAIVARSWSLCFDPLS
jgi:hypothetical protein